METGPDLVYNGYSVIRMPDVAACRNKKSTKSREIKYDRQNMTAHGRIKANHAFINKAMEIRQV
jgi:hypothetical protein